MSAFMVGKTHIDAMVSAGLHGGGRGGRMAWYFPKLESGGWEEINAKRQELNTETADRVGAMLWSENLRSINYRYPDTEDGGMVPGPSDFTPMYIAEYRFKDLIGGAISPYSQVRPVDMLGALACYEYQTCEHPGWPDSEAFAFCDALRHLLIHKLPGYSDAPWEISDPNFFRAPVARRG